MAQDRAYQRKGAPRSGNTGKEGPIYESLAESGEDEQFTPAAQHYCGNELMRVLLSLRTEVQQGYIQEPSAMGTSDERHLPSEQLHVQCTR